MLAQTNKGFDGSIKASAGDGAVASRFPFVHLRRAVSEMRR